MSKLSPKQEPKQDYTGVVEAVLVEGELAGLEEKTLQRKLGTVRLCLDKFCFLINRFSPPKREGSAQTWLPSLRRLASVADVVRGPHTP